MDQAKELAFELRAPNLVSIRHRYAHDSIPRFYNSGPLAQQEHRDVLDANTSFRHEPFPLG